MVFNKGDIAEATIVELVIAMLSASSICTPSFDCIKLFLMTIFLIGISGIPLTNKALFAPSHTTLLIVKFLKMGVASVIGNFCTITLSTSPFIFIGSVAA